MNYNFKDEGLKIKMHTNAHLECRRFDEFQHCLNSEAQTRQVTSEQNDQESVRAHNLQVAREKEHDHQLRLRRLHQFLCDEMNERDKKTRNHRSIQIFKERKKKAIFLNYDLRFVSENSSKLSENSKP